MEPSGRRAMAPGPRVHVLDDLSTGAMDNIRISRPARLRLHVDQLRRAAVWWPSSSTTPTCVFHLAAAVGVELIVESPVRTIETNVHCTEVVLAAANKKRKPVFLASTSEVYGKNAELPFREDGDLLLGPTTRAAGPTPARRRSTSSSRWRTGKERGLPVGDRPPVQHRRPAADRPLRHGGPDLRAPGARRASRSRSTATASSGAASATSTTSCARLPTSWTTSGRVGEVFNIGSTEEVAILGARGARARARAARTRRSR